MNSTRQHLRQVFFIGWLVGLISLGSACVAVRQPAFVNDGKAKEYFQARIAGATTENSLIAFTDVQTTKNLKRQNIDHARATVWSLWKETNRSIETLPEATLADVAPEPFPVHTWELKEENPMPFYFIRKGEREEGPAPLFLNLHGSGPKAGEFIATLKWSIRYDDRDSYYFIPQIPSEQRYRWWYRPIQYTWERLFRLAMLDERIDPDRLFIIGISEGGYGSQRLGAYYADYLAGVGPMAGGEPLENAPPLNFRHVAFSFQTGENDRMFGRNKYTLEAKERFESLAAKYEGQFKHQIELQPGRGHAIDYTVTTPWLRPFVRTTRPDHISWVHFPMDGRYRKGFYNVGIDRPFPIQEGAPLDRVLFDIQYEDNQIYISAELTNGDLSERQPLEQLAISLFLDEGYVDLDRAVKVFVNGHQVYDGMVDLNVAYLIESCGLFADPSRLFPGKITIRHDRGS